MKHSFDMIISPRKNKLNETNEIKLGILEIYRNEWQIESRDWSISWLAKA